MALGDKYTADQVDATIDELLPILNDGRELKLPRNTVRALIAAENMGKDGVPVYANRQSVVNGGPGAVGVAQVMPATLAGLKKTKYLPDNFPDDLSTAGLKEQLAAGMAAMAGMADELGSVDPVKLAMYYNGGSRGKVAAKTGRTDTLRPETQGHIKKVVNFLNNDNPGYVPPTGFNVPSSPVFSSTPLAQAQQAFGQFANMVPDVRAALGAGTAMAKQQVPVLEAAITGAGEAAAESARQQAEITISEQVAHRSFLNALGLDILDPQARVNELLRERASADATRKSTEQARLASRAKIADMQGVTLFSNPIEYIMNIPLLQREAAQHNLLVDQENAAAGQVKSSMDEITKLYDIVTHVKNLAPAKAADNIRMKAAADARLQVESATANLAKTRIDATAGVAKNALDMLSLESNVFGKLLSLENAQAQRAEARTRMSMAEAAADERREREELRQEGRDAKAAEAKKGENLAAGINLYRKMLNGNAVPELSRDEVNAMPAELKGAWTEVLLRGNLGNSYAESIPFIERFGNMQAAAAQGNSAMMLAVRNMKMEAEKLVPEIQRSIKQQSAGLSSVSSQQALQLAYNQLFKKHAGLAARGEPKEGIQDTPYAIDLDSALATGMGAGIKDNVVLSQLAIIKQQKPYEDLKGKVTDRFILDAIAADVAAGKIEPKKAAEQTAQFYALMSANGFKAGGLGYLGLPMLHDYTILAGAKGVNKVDMMSPTRLENYFTSQVAKQKSMNRVGMNLPFPN